MPTPTPAPAVPSISGESGREGWAAIKEEAANASEGQLLHIAMNGTINVPGDVLDSVKGQDVTLSFDMGNGAVWSVNGRNVTAEHANDINLSVQVGTSAVPQDIVNQVAGEQQTIQLSLGHSGDFGCSPVLILNVDPAHAGMYANLFYYVESEGRLEFVTAGKISEDGKTELQFTHASDYVIVVNDGVMDGDNGGNSPGDNSEPPSSDKNTPQEGETLSPKTGEVDSVIMIVDIAESEPEDSRLNFIWLFLLGAAGLAAAGAVTFLLKKRKTSAGIQE